MSSEVLIAATGISKRYSIYDRPHHRFAELLGGRPRAREFWALRGVDLELRAGETLGIVGRNGSGKSTLLQVLCGTLKPTLGSVSVKGRVAALLELGAGFNPEFSGRENVYLNASLMGLDRAEVDRHLPDILAFADIGEFLDQPVRTYSSGMFVRLAFAVAIAVQPDILVIDEALAVGDEAFQRKCYARIEQMKSNGAAVVFVSHSAGSILQLCDRALLMEAGAKILEGHPKPVVASYQRLVYAGGEQKAQVLSEINAMGGLATLEEPANPIGEVGIAVSATNAEEYFDPDFRPQSTMEYPSRGAVISDIRLINSDGRPVNVLAPGRRYRYAYSVGFDRVASNVRFGMLIKAVDGIELFGMSSHAIGSAIPLVAAGTRIDVEFEFVMNLLPGTYFMNAGCQAAVEGEGETFLHRVVDALVFRIEVGPSDRRFAGFVNLAVEPACSITYGGSSGVP